MMLQSLKWKVVLKPDWMESLKSAMQFSIIYVKNEFSTI